MDSLHVITWSLVAVSGLVCLLIIREFMHTSTKRANLLRKFDQQDIRGTKQSRFVLVAVYVVTTVMFTLAFAWWLFQLLP